MKSPPAMTSSSSPTIGTVTTPSKVTYAAVFGIFHHLTLSKAASSTGARSRPRYIWARPWSQQDWQWQDYYELARSTKNIQINLKYCRS